MSTFDSTKTLLSELLSKVVKGKLQLPDFSAGGLGRRAHSVAAGQHLAVVSDRRVMLLETGGETRFQVRPVEGVDLPPTTNPEELILDGQQRLTSLTQVLKLDKPAATRDAKKRELKLHYIESAMGKVSAESAPLAEDEDDDEDDGEAA